MQHKQKKIPGPIPETLRLEGSWQGAMRKAVKKKKPKEGWPKPEETKKD